MKYVWAVLAVLYALLSIYVGYLFVVSATGEKLGQKGFLLQAAPLFGGIALILLSLPLIWNAMRLVTAKTSGW
ncbi:MAG: hypothetical protein JO057_04695 [Chloroflexi bacterium]|nr:hypothetical protein [Chloroflexota bacterium]